MAAPVPELEPHGLRSSAYGLRVWPPRPLHPLVECDERKFAHSLQLVLPRMIAPAARSRCTTNASAGAGMSASASEPALVLIRSPVSMLSLMRIGTPCSGPRILPAFRSASRRVGLGDGLGVELDDRVDRRTRVIDGGDTVEVLPGDCRRGEVPRRHRLLQPRRSWLPRASNSGRCRRRRRRPAAAEPGTHQRRRRRYSRQMPCGPSSISVSASRSPRRCQRCAGRTPRGPGNAATPT